MERLREKENEAAQEEDLVDELSDDEIPDWTTRESYRSMVEDGYLRRIDRDDPDLIEVVEELGVEEASGKLAELKIVEVPDDVDWEVKEYDGKEWVAEKHRTWS